jgi:HEAT repeat protein
VEPLLAAVNDRQNEVRRLAIAALGDLGDSRALKPLIGALRHHDASVRVKAIVSLGKLGDAQAVEPLIAVLRKDPDVNVGKAAARALGGLGDARAAEALVAVLKRAAKEASHPMAGRGRAEAEVAEATVEAARELGAARVMQPLEDAILRMEDAAVRQRLQRYLAEIGRP